MVIVVSPGDIALRPQPLDPEFVLEALEGPSPSFDASYRICPGNESHFRISDGSVMADGATVVGDG